MAAGSANSSSTSTGNGSNTVHEAGTFNGTKLNLSVVNYDQSSSASFAFHEDNSSNYEASVSGNLDLDLIGVSGSLALSGNESSSLDGEGGAQATSHRSGSRINNLLHLTEIVNDSNSSSTYSGQATGNSHMDGNLSGFVELLGNQANGSFEYESNSSYTIQSDGDSASTTHEEGERVGSQLSLFCIVMTESSHESSTYHSSENSGYTATLSGQMELNFQIGVIGGGFSVTSTDESTSDIDSLSTRTSYRDGRRVAGQPLSLDSLSLDESSSQSFTNHSETTFDYTGYITGNLAAACLAAPRAAA